jgi:peptide/nickel transport system permease protein
MTTATTTPEEASEIRRQSPLRETWDNLRRSPPGLIGLALILIHIGIAFTAPSWVPFEPVTMDPDVRAVGPSTEHPFGTDKLGRDILSRTMVGGRIAISVTALATSLAILWGGTVGILLGFAGGQLDEIAMRGVDAFLALPGLLFLLLIINIVGTSIWILAATLGFFSGISIIRIARAATLDFVARDFVVAARARGEKRRTIMFRELYPNVRDVLLVEGAMRFSWILLSFGGLAFLGFGVSPPDIDWGLMIGQNREILGVQPWATFGPVLMLSTLIIGINLFADALAKAIGLDRSQGAPL